MNVLLQAGADARIRNKLGIAAFEKASWTLLIYPTLIVPLQNQIFEQYGKHFKHKAQLHWGDEEIATLHKWIEDGREKEVERQTQLYQTKHFDIFAASKAIDECETHLEKLRLEIRAMKKETNAYIQDGIELEKHHDVLKEGIENDRRQILAIKQKHAQTEAQIIEYQKESDHFQLRLNGSFCV